MLIGLNGKAGAGKDTVADYLVKNYGFKRYAFADAVRDAALAINPVVVILQNNYERLDEVVRVSGWDTAKRTQPEVRRLLQVIGTEVGRQILGENCWVDIVASKWEADGYPDAVITDLRFPNEAAYVEENFGWVVCVDRPDNPDAIATTHASEQYTPEADYTLKNNSSLGDLYMKTDDLVAQWQDALLR